MRDRDVLKASVLAGLQTGSSPGGCHSLPPLLFTSETQTLSQLPLGAPSLSLSLLLPPSCSFAQPPPYPLTPRDSFMHITPPPPPLPSILLPPTASRSRPALFCMCGGGGVTSGGVRGHGESKPAAVERKRLGRRPASWPGSLVSMPEAGTNWEYGCCCCCGW